MIKAKKIRLKVFQCSFEYQASLVSVNFLKPVHTKWAMDNNPNIMLPQNGQNPGPGSCHDPRDKLLIVSMHQYVAKTTPIKLLNRSCFILSRFYNVN